MKLKTISILIFTLVCSCNGNKKTGNTLVEDLPEVIAIERLQKTDFVATLENTFSENMNYIYTPTMLYAWNEIKNELPGVRIMENKDSRDIILLDESKKHINSLSKDEYNTSISINGEELIAKSDFNLQLTFEPLLEKLVYPIYFKEEKVEGFGMHEWDSKMASLIEVIYFLDNENFIFKLKPKEANMELIFIKGLRTNNSRSFNDILDIYSTNLDKGKKENTDHKLNWKYELQYGETFGIPELSFNVSKNYSSIVGQEIYNETNTFVVLEAQQRIALLLNNKGAKIESEALIAVASTDAEDTEEVKQIEKHLVLDNSFFLIIKHIDQVNPFFCAKIENTELMKKHKDH